MTDINMTKRLSIHAAAAAVALALGTSFAQAQQPRGGEERSQRQEAVQESREAQDRAQTQQRRAEQRAEDAEERAEDAARTQERRAQSNQQRSSSGGDLSDLADDYDDLSTFSRALETAGLIDSLSDGTNYTIFAPTDEAFESMRGDTDDLLAPENRERLVALLRAHIVADDVDAVAAGRLSEARTLDGDTIELQMEDGKLMVEDATVIDTDIERGNVRIHTIDEVLDAPTRVATRDNDDDDDRGLR